jgi:hypothetical protein
MAQAGEIDQGKTEVLGRLVLAFQELERVVLGSSQQYLG